MTSYSITRKLNHYRNQLAVLYKGDEETLLKDIVNTSPIYIDEAVHYDNWDQGITMHNLIFYLSEEVYRRIGKPEKISEIGGRIKDDFNRLSASVRNETVNAVYIELFNYEDNECRNAILPNDLTSVKIVHSTFWQPEYLKLFISHRNVHKKVVSELSQYLLPYGISCFIAHEDIEPTEEWRNEIENALRSMEVFLAFLTDDFSDGDWTNQEVGFAIARGIPIIPLKMSCKNPHGFMSIYQALHGQIENIPQLTTNIFNLICLKFDKKSLVKKATIAAFINSTDFEASGEAFKRLETFNEFSDIELENLVSRFNKNSQLYQYYLTNCGNKFFNFIQLKSNNRYELTNNKIHLINAAETPF